MNKKLWVKEILQEKKEGGRKKVEKKMGIGITRKSGSRYAVENKM